MAMDPQYSSWNLAIGKHFFCSEHNGQTVFLTVNELTLWKIGQEFGTPLQFESPKEAVSSLVESVRREVHRCGGWTVGHMVADQYPSFLGLLAVQVLAAFMMHIDEKW